MDKSLLKKKIDNEKKQVKIIVKDSGTGIDKEILPRLFEKFAKVRGWY